MARRRAVIPMAGSIAQNGSTGGVLLGNNFNKAYNDAFSVSMWLNGTSGSNAIIAGKWSFGNPGWVLMWNYTALLSDSLYFALTTGVVAAAVRSSGVLKKGKWQHIVMTYSGSGTVAGVNFYVDGVVTSKATDADVLAGGVTTNALNASIGCNAAGTVNFTGSETNVRLHDAELTAAQVANLYYDGTAVSVQAEWLMTDGSGTTLTASVGGVNGTITTPVWSPSAPTKARTTSTARTSPATIQNVFTYSEDFTQSGVYTTMPTYGTVLADEVANPFDGAVTADRITSTTGTQVLWRAFTATSRSSTISCWVKNGTMSGANWNAGFIIYNATTAVTLIGTSSVAVGIGSTAYGFYNITDAGNSWLRIDMTVTSGFTSGNTMRFYFGASGAITIGQYFWIWGLQYTKANWSGPYAPTTSAAVDTGNIRGRALTLRTTA